MRLEARSAEEHEPFQTVLTVKEKIMGRGIILWMLGVPIPVLLLMWALGWLS